MKKLSVALFVLILLSLSMYTVVSANDAIRVTIDGQQISFTDQTPVIVENRTLVPIRDVFEFLGFEPKWYEPARRATLTRDDTVIIVTIGSDVFTTNGVSHNLDVPAQIIGGRTMLPLRAILESIGYELDWDGNTRTVIISTRLLVQRRWQLPRYINTNPRVSDSNNRLASALQNLHNSTLFETTNSFPSALWGTWSPRDIPTFAQQDIEFDAQIRQTLQTGFANDTLRYVLPFNEAYWNSLTDAITYHVWRLASNEPAAAVWTITGGEMHIFMGTEPSGRSYPQDMMFANFTFHEVANIIGLGDPISELLSEELTGRPSVWGPTATMRHDPTFVRLLMEQVEPVEFWRAAHTSNEDVVQHWNYHFGEIVPASHLQMAWGVEEAFIWSSELRSRFHSETEISEQTRLGLSTSFANGSTHVVAAILEQIYVWGVENSISPYPFVHDARIMWREQIMADR